MTLTSKRFRGFRRGDPQSALSGLEVGRIIKRHLSAAMRSDPQFLVCRRFPETAFFKGFDWHL